MKKKKIKAPLRLRRFLRKCVKKNRRKSFIMALSYLKIISAVMMTGVGVLIIILPIEAEGKMEIATQIIKGVNFIFLLFLAITKAVDRIKDSNRFYNRLIIS